MSAVARHHLRAQRPALDPRHQLEVLAGIGMRMLVGLDNLGGHVIAWRAQRRLAAAEKNRVSWPTAVVATGVASLVALFAWGAAGNVSGENAWLTTGPAGAATTAAAPLISAPAPRHAHLAHSATRKGSTPMMTHPTRTTRAALAAGSLAALGVLGGTAAAATPSAHHAAKVFHKTLVIATPNGNGKAGWPRYVDSSNIVLPKDATVVLTIKSHDDGAAPLPKNVIFYDKVMGTVGNKETVDGKAVTSVANKVISHTFTIADLGINLAIPAAPTGKVVTVQATIHTGKAGTYTWQCYAPCGSGKGSMHGAMDAVGYMKGTVTVR